MSRQERSLDGKCPIISQDESGAPVDCISVDFIMKLTKSLNQIDLRYKNRGLSQDQCFENLKNELREDLDDRSEDLQGYRRTRTLPGQQERLEGKDAGNEGPGESEHDFIADGGVRDAPF